MTGRAPPAVTTSATSVRPTRARWSGEAKEAGEEIEWHLYVIYVLQQL